MFPAYKVLAPKYKKKKNSNQVFHLTRWKLEWGFTTFNLLGFEVLVKKMKAPN